MSRLQVLALALVAAGCASGDPEGGGADASGAVDGAASDGAVSDGAPTDGPPASADAATSPDATAATDAAGSPDATVTPDAAVPTDAQPLGPCEQDQCFYRPIALGEMFACAIRANGKVACWGNGRWGVLGDGSEDDNPVPAEIDSLSDVVQVTAGAKHACALLANSQVWCWGYNTFNQLGDGNTTGPEMCDDGNETSSVRCSTVPVQVAGLPTDIVQVEGGKFYTCALSESSGMYCWGSPQDGVLGNGETTGQFAQATESTVANAEGSIAVLAPGGRHNCVLLESGTDRVRCWGYQGDGRLGNGSTTATAVTAPQTVVQANVGFLSSGEAQSCVVLTNGDVRCWGDNAQSELGNGSTDDAPTPTPVSDTVGTEMVSVEIGDSLGHVCTATAGGTSQCWGYNSSGECGNDTTTPKETATTVMSLSGVDYVGTGIYHSCAYRTDGTVYCWGMRSQCQMGDGNCDAGVQPTPVQVSDFP